MNELKMPVNAGILAHLIRAQQWFFRSASSLADKKFTFKLKKTLLRKLQSW